ncbi:MAG: hypothetical protein LBB23_04680 [Rickettsiales bacterium]|jgi:hypothetical protein|nr:hypothetical protein [Rickettsiales bacterium]
MQKTLIIFAVLIASVMPAMGALKSVEEIKSGLDPAGQEKAKKIKTENDLRDVLALTLPCKPNEIIIQTNPAMAGCPEPAPSAPCAGKITIQLSEEERTYFNSLSDEEDVRRKRAEIQIVPRYCSSGGYYYTAKNQIDCPCGNKIANPYPIPIDPVPTPPVPPIPPSPPDPPVPVATLADLSAFQLDKASWLKKTDGETNWKRIGFDAGAAVAVGALGGFLTNHLVKANQVDKGFDQVQCSVGGISVAGWGDQLSVGAAK